MKSIVATALLTLGLVTTAGVSAATAQSLGALSSACRTGDFEACSQYNAAIIAQRGSKLPVLSQGYDPFAIVPATHSTRTPSQPKKNSADIAVGKAAPILDATKNEQ